MAEIVPIDRLLRKRRWASACAHYAALSEAEVEALSTSELIQAHFCVWLTRQQCGKRKRFVKCGPALCPPYRIYGTGRCSSHPFLFKMSL